jgi:hypothetical protein
VLIRFVINVEGPYILTSPLVLLATVEAEYSDPPLRWGKLSLDMDLVEGGYPPLHALSATEIRRRKTLKGS